MKIVVLDGYALNPGDMSWSKIEELGDVTVYDRTPRELVAERAAGAEALITNKTVIDSDMLVVLPDVRYIGVLATGYNVVDVDEARRRGIVVTNIPAYSTASVAQMVWALLLAIVNRVEHYAVANSEGRWAASADFCYWDTPLTELAGKCMGVVGFGNIGRAVAKIALAMGMRVAAVTSKAQSELPDGVEKMTLDQLLVTADVVSLHCPLTPDTHHIINQQTLALMKPTAILINTGRGPLVDEEALARTLNEQRLYAAGLDVLATEPPCPDNPLLTARNCYITPHIAWASREARERLMSIAADNLRAFIAGKPVNNVAR